MVKQILNKSLKVLAIVFVALLAFLLVLMLYFNSKPGQRKLSSLVFGKLSDQIGTPISGNLSFSIPDWVRLDNLLIIDQKSDTLLYAKRAHLDVALFRLLRNELMIEQVELENAVAKIDKENKTFNFDYIIDAFSSDTPAAPKDTTAASMKITLDGINAKNLRVKYEDKDLDQLFNVQLGELTSGFNTLDPGKAIYDLKNSRISGLTVNGRLGKPSEDTTASGPLPDIRVKELLAENLNWDIDLGEQVTTGKNASLGVNLDKINLQEMEFEVRKFSTTSEQLTFSDKKAKASPSGQINFGDLAVSDFILSAENLGMTDSLMTGTISRFQFKEKSGLELAALQTKASLKGTKLLLEGTEIATGRSKIKTEVIVDLDTVNYGKSRFDARISELKLAASEAFYFDRTLIKNPTFSNIRNDVFTGKGRVHGTAEEIGMDYVHLTAPSNTRLTLNGKIFNRNVLGLDLQIRDFSTTEKDLNKFAGTLPESIQLPERLVLNGSVKGNMENLNAEVFLNSSQGGARLTGNLKNLSKVPEYSAELIIEDYALGTLIKNTEVGRIQGKLEARGRSFDNPSLEFKADISEVNYAGAAYQNITLSGNLENNIVMTQGAIKDPKASLDLDVVINMSQEVMTVTGKVNIEKASLKALGVTEENIELAGNFDINQLIADLKKPFIDFKGSNITVYKDSEVFPIGDLTVLTEYGEEEKSLDLTAAFMNLSLSGNFEYDRLQNILMTEVNKYFSLPDFVPVTDSLDFHFDIKGTINYNPVFTAFVPSLRNFQPVTINSELKSEGDIPFSGQVSIPFLLYDSIQVVNTTFNFTGDGKELKYALETGEISNPGFRIRKAGLLGKLEENVATFDLAVKDSLDQDIHSLAGLVESDGQKIRVSFDESGSMLFYEEWGGNPYGYIDYSSEGLYINNLVFSSKGQFLRVNSVSETPNSPLTVFAERLDLNFLSRAVLQDSTLIAGYLDLDLELVNYMGENGLAFTGEADIKDFQFNGVALGDLNAKAESEDMEKIGVFASLKGQNNDFNLSGGYFTKREESLDFNIDIGSLDLKAIEPFMEGIAYDLKGQVNGDLEIKGSPSKPKIDGAAEFSGMEFRIQETAALLKIDNQKLGIGNSKIVLKDFRIKDANNQDMVLNGSVDFSTLPDLAYDLNMSSENFLIASSERGQSELFYGTAYLASKLNIKGKNAEFRVTGDITTKENTNLTLLLPDESMGADLNSVVTFVDFRNPEKNSQDKTKKAFSLANALNINVFVDPKTTINMLMNPITGDMLSASGDARLNVGFDNGGDLFIVGRMDITKGSYELTFQAIKKSFQITESSKSYISFTGDPLKGQMNITAEYNVPGRKDLRDFEPVGGSKLSKETRLPAELRVDLVLTGEVLSPEIDFQIVTKEEEVIREVQNVKNMGLMVVNEEGEKTGGQEGAIGQSLKESINQNAIMLLVTGNFMSGQILDSFGGGGQAYEDMARRNASQLISSQLERYASGLIKGVDLNLGLESSGGGAAREGEEKGADRSTNLNLGLSKSLANDRLTVSVGKNFELENSSRRSDEIFDNVEANWNISRDGRYRAKVFRKNQNQSALEGSVIETGLGFIIAIDYDTWKELMKRKK